VDFQASFYGSLFIWAKMFFFCNKSLTFILKSFQPMEFIQELCPKLVKQVGSLHVKLTDRTPHITMLHCTIRRYNSNKEFH